MEMKCPKCGSEHVQAVRVILQSGTTYSNGSFTGVGLGDGAGIFAGSTGGMNQTTLAARFSPPKKPSKLEIIAGGIFSLATSPWLFSKQPVVVIPLGIMAWWACETYSYRKKNKRYQEQYPKWQKMHQYGFYCHRCGTSYIP